MSGTLAENRKDRDTLLVASQLLKDNGIKTRIIKTYLPAMNQLINQYLQSMDFYVNFTLNENFEEIIKSRYRDVFSYDSFSEGEKSRIDIALLLTWRSIAKLKNSVDTNLLTVFCECATQLFFIFNKTLKFYKLCFLVWVATF